MHFSGFNITSRKLWLVLISLAFFKITSATPLIIEKKVDFGWRKSSTRAVNSIIIHSAFNNSGGDQYDIDLVIKQFRIYKVSSHYIIGRDGNIYLLVNEENTAFHAGKSRLPDGTGDVNDRSIGIEIITSFTESPTEIQMHSLKELVNDIRRRYDIKYILRHSDIAPERKTDPWNFDWEAFSAMLKTHEIINSISE